MRLVLPPLLLAVAMSLSGCWTSASEFMREPFFSPVGSGLVTEETASIQSAKVLPLPRLLETGRRRPFTASRGSPTWATSCGC
jgi:hypothetical protein